MTDRITAKDFVANVIVQGFEEGAQTFTEGLEDELRHTVQMDGIEDPEAHLESMIEEAVTETSQFQTHEHFAEVSSKINGILGH